MAATPISTFASHQLNLLSAELAAETAATALLTSTHSPTSLARYGLAVTNLVVDSQRTGLGGKTVLELGRDSAVATVGGKDKGRSGDGRGKHSKSETAGEANNAGGLGQHDVRVGDVVGIGQQPKGSEKKKTKSELEQDRVEAVVVKVRQDTIEVAVDREDDAEKLGGRMKLWMWVSCLCFVCCLIARPELIFVFLYIALNLQMKSLIRGTPDVAYGKARAHAYLIK